MTAIHEHALGLTWVMDDALQRTCHALVEDGRVWLIDPVDDAEAMERVGGLGSPAGVIQLLDRHDRDNAAIASRLGVPHHRLPDSLPGTPFEVERVVDGPVWKERALWWPERKALVVAEALGTGRLFALGPGPVGVHPMLRLRPPRRLARHRPEHLLVGHGAPVHGPETAAAIDEALARSRRDMAKLPGRLVGVLRGKA
jgi:hypothetical protein